MAEMSAQLDRVIAQNRQLVVAVSQIADSIVTQSDNTQFLLHEVADLKTEMRDLKTEVHDFKTEVNVQFSEVNTKVDGVNAKVDLILQILQSGNGRH